MTQDPTRTVVITGSTKGIGRALAGEFARLGHRVVLSGRDTEALGAAVADLKASGGTVAGHELDVIDPDSHQGLWDFAVATFGRVDIWINNAGVAHTTHTIVDTTPDSVRTMVNTNMLGTIFGSQTAVRGLQAQGGGQLFNVLGGGSDGRIRPHMGVYGATKRGLDMFTRALVKEVDGTGVRVGQIRPGILITDGWLREAASAPEQVASQRRLLNILVDHVEDVVPELTARMLASTKNGDEIAWLTTTRMTKRFMNPSYTIGEPIEVKRTPETGYQAQFSGPYAFAAGLIGGGGLATGLDDYTDALASEPLRRELMAKVEVVSDDECNEIYPFQFPAVVTVTTTSGEVLVEKVLTNRGGPARPLSDAELGRKFSDNVAGRLAPEVAAATSSQILSLHTVTDLAATLQPLSTFTTTDSEESQ